LRASKRNSGCDEGDFLKVVVVVRYLPHPAAHHEVMDGRVDI
jgi:hypothetical protein